ncbi:lysophospholipid acyltransferase family protein [Propylenella binzhouense]|uniref:DUF374 domain-containing protein n=1 Tax=Propylenella binzhouense TaxID=2555902 RepID=A0A964T8A8_9HYPH|nr:lysophospholipid acyltransferase family protein [Propylenella binzhouense]MYZ49915.1 DUF374 domain-containing protein [Propylenella binzhouense]
MAEESGRARAILGRSLAAYLKLVRRSTRFVFEPADAQDVVDGFAPVIVGSWHGQHLLVPLMRRSGQDFAVLVSRSADGDVNAAAAASMGLHVIRGSGGRNRLKSAQKGGSRGFLEMLTALRSGLNVALTADVPRGEARRCGPGIVALARHSGRPIVPVAVATRFAVTFDTWDKARLPLPLGRGAMVMGEPVFVAADSDEAAVDRARRHVEDALNRCQDRADELAGRG